MANSLKLLSAVKLLPLLKSSTEGLSPKDVLEQIPKKIASLPCALPDSVQDFLHLVGRIHLLPTTELFECDGSTINQLLETDPNKISTILLSEPAQLSTVLLVAAREGNLSLFSRVLEIVDENCLNFWELCALDPIFALAVENNRIEMLEKIRALLPADLWLSSIEKHFTIGVSHNHVELIKCFLSSVPPDQQAALVLSQPFIILSIKDKETDENRKLQMIDTLLTTLASEEQKIQFVTKTSEGVNVVVWAAKVNYEKTILLLTNLLPPSERETFLTFPCQPGIDSGEKPTPLFFAKTPGMVKAILGPLSPKTRDDFASYKHLTYETVYYAVSTAGYCDAGSRLAVKGRSALDYANQTNANAILELLSNNHPFKRKCQIL